MLRLRFTLAAIVATILSTTTLFAEVDFKLLSPGCQDENACNYDPTATEDDGSCTYPSVDYLDCNGDCLSDTDGDGICDGIDLCSDVQACNYDGGNGVCQYTDDCGICGGEGVDADDDGICDDEDLCTDVTACNYMAPSNDACQMLDACGVCGGDGVDLDEDGLCEGANGVDNCADITACNYLDPVASECLYEDVCGVCGGDDAGDTNGNGVCDTEETGCTDPDATNYDADALFSANEGCEYFSAGCVPVFDPEIIDTIYVSCKDELPMEAPEQVAYDPCTDGNPAVPVLDEMLDMDTLTACGQFVTYRYMALNISYGLIGVQTQTWMVNDTTGPVISSIPEDLVVACTDDSTAYGMVEAMDSCHDVLDIAYHIDSTYTDTVAYPDCPGNYLVDRTVTARDVCMNVTTGSYTITVRDLVPPVLGDVPMSDTLTCDIPAPTALPIYTDACSEEVDFTLSSDTVAGDCPQNYTLIRTFTVEDECGNSSSASQHVVFIDTLAPSILTMPGDLLLACVDTVPADSITASDLCSLVIIDYLDSLTAGDCPQNYTIERWHSAEDQCGNVALHMQTIEVVDTVAPMFTDLEEFVTIDCNDAGAAMAAAEDSCSAVTLTFATFSAYGSSMPGQQFRLYTAADECGNTTEGIQLVSLHEGAACAGCTNPTAENYDAAAVVDDGSCEFGGVYSEGGQCVNDADDDGICDELEIVGCMDTLACNFTSYATDSDESLCLFPMDPARDCAGECLNDADGDGVCDENEMPGCMDPSACNFNEFATDSATGDCEFGCQGCTYDNALNYDAEASIEDGSCHFSFEGTVETTCEGDADGDGQIGILDLLAVLDSFGSYCE